MYGAVALAYHIYGIPAVYPRRAYGIEAYASSDDLASVVIRVISYYLSASGRGKECGILRRKLFFESVIQ